MAHGGEEGALGVVGGLGRGTRLLRLPEQPRVLDRDHGLIGEGLEERELLVAERLRRHPRDLDRAHAAPFPQHRREGDREIADG